MHEQSAYVTPVHQVSTVPRNATRAGLWHRIMITCCSIIITTLLWGVWLQPAKI
jgi:hypothetical protein